jgi:hypothetical protein
VVLGLVRPWSRSRSRFGVGVGLGLGLLGLGLGSRLGLGVLCCVVFLGVLCCVVAPLLECVETRVVVLIFLPLHVRAKVSRERNKQGWWS